MQHTPVYKKAIFVNVRIEYIKFIVFDIYNTDDTFLTNLKLFIDCQSIVSMPFDENYTVFFGEEALINDGHKKQWQIGYDLRFRPFIGNCILMRKGKRSKFIDADREMLKNLIKNVRFSDLE